VMTRLRRRLPPVREGLVDCMDVVMGGREPMHRAGGIGSIMGRSGELHGEERRVARRGVA